MPTIVSIQVGQPQTHGTPDAADPMDQTWTSAIFKEPVDGPVRVGRTKIEGDGQANPESHGGTDKAVLAYSADHYPQWRETLSIADLPYGAFGENLTIAGQTESDVCIGDIWQAGEVRFEVSQPRQPCWKLARRWRIRDLPKLVVQTGRAGWYLRVLQEGMIEAGVDIELIDRPHKKWTIARANEALYGQLNRVAVVELASLPELADSWKSDLI